MKLLCIDGNEKKAVDAGAVSNWHTITAFTATPASTSTLPMSSDQTATIKAGSGLKYVIGGTAYQGVCTAITSNLLTIAGAPLSGDVTSLSWTHIPCIAKEFVINGAFADATDTALLEHDLLMKGGYKWYHGKAYLALLGISTKNHDSAASTQATLNVKLAGSDALSTALTIPNAVYTQSVVQFTVANCDINYGEAIEMSVTAASGGTPANDAKDLIAILIFVPELP